MDRLPKSTAQIEVSQVAPTDPNEDPGITTYIVSRGVTRIMVPLRARISGPFTAAHLAEAARTEASQTGNFKLLEIAKALDKVEEMDENTQNNQALEVAKDMIQVATAIQDPNEGQQVIQDIVQEHRTTSWQECKQNTKKRNPTNSHRYLGHGLRQL